MKTPRLTLRWTEGWKNAQIVPAMDDALDGALSFLSSHCHAAAQLDAAIDVLIADLEVIRVEARRRFAEAS